MKILVGAAIGLILVACSSSDDTSGSACEYVGTYAMQSVGEVSAAACMADDPDAGATGQGARPTTTVTISGPVDGAYAVQLEGLQGACRGEVVAGCKLQTQCNITLTDASDPNDDVGTYQFSWAFAHAGFTGSETLNLPPAKNYSHGCRGDANVTATRR